MPFHKWEDWRAGMYSSTYTQDHVEESASLLSDVDRFYETAREMMREWAHAANHNLVYLWTGRNAWIGQASCTYAHGAPSAATREAWGSMTGDQQRAANLVALLVRNEWEVSDGSQTLFDV